MSLAVAFARYPREDGVLIFGLLPAFSSSRLGLGRAPRIGISGRHRMVVGQRTPSASPDT